VLHTQGLELVGRAELQGFGFSVLSLAFFQVCSNVKKTKFQIFMEFLPLVSRTFLFSQGFGTKV